jgi:signal transduction histidine kinase
VIDRARGASVELIPESGDGVHPIEHWRDDVAAAWVEILLAISPKLARIDQTILSQAIHEGIDVMVGCFNPDAQPFDVFLERLNQGFTRAGMTVGDVVRTVLSGSDALDVALPATERFHPAVIVSERALREVSSRFAERAVSVVTARLETTADELRESNAKMLALQRVGAAVTGSLALDETLNKIVSEAANLMDVPSARLRLPDETGEHLRLKAVAGDLLDDQLGSLVPIEHTLAGLCFKTHEPVVSNDAWNDPRGSLRSRNLPTIRSLLSVPLLSRGTAIGVLSVVNRSGRPFDQGDQEVLGLFADYAASAIENARLYTDAQDEITRLEILNRVSKIVSSSLELDSVYGAIHQEIARIMTADAFLIFLKNEAGRYDLSYVVDEGVRYSPRHDVALPFAYSEALQRRHPAVIETADSPDFGGWERYGDMERHVQSIVVAPLVRSGEPIGLLSAQSYLPRSYRARDVDLLVTVANVAVVAIENARLYDQAHDLAVAEERNRLAREIHDTIAQGLVGIILQLEAMSSALEESNPLGRRIDRALELARVNLDEARRSVQNLRAAPLAQHTFTEALRRLADEYRADCGGEVVVSLPQAMPLIQQQVETAFYRLAQEALNNCRKHAGASIVWIDVTIDSGLSVRIQDDGVGFDVDAWRDTAPQHRFGLHGMRERIEQIGGQFDIRPRPAGGTEILARVPMIVAAERR